MVVIVSSFVFYNISEAKRMAPEKVKPIVYNGVKYTADKMNYVEAWNAKTGEKLWELKVYDVTYNPAIEPDVQDIWITSLRIEEGKLIVAAERNREYEINLETKEINKRQDPSKIKEKSNE